MGTIENTETGDNKARETIQPPDDREKAVLLHVLQSTDRRRAIAELIGDGSSYEHVLLAAKCLTRIGENAYRDLVAISPANVYLHQQFGRAFRQLKFYRQAQQALEDAVKLEPHRASARFELADVLVELGSLEAAEHQYEKALALSGNEILYRFGLSNVNLKRRNLAEASVQLNAARDALTQMQAETHHRQGHLLEAEGHLDDALGEYQIAVSLTDGAHYWFHIGALHRRLGRISEAREALQNSISRRPGDADAHFQMGALLEESGEVAEALREYRITADLALNAETHFAIGRACRKLGDLTQAVIELQRSISIDPSIPEVIVELGLVHEKRDEFDLALECYRRALSIKPEVPEYYQRAGLMLKVLGRLSEAETELSIAVKLAPTKAEYREQLGHMLAACSRYREALDQHNASASLRPSDPIYRYNVGVMHAKLGNHDAAIKALSEAIKLCSAGASQNEPLPPSMAAIAADAHGDLGLLFEKLEQPQQAMQHYQTAAELMPFAKGFWLRQGLLYRQLGQLYKAFEVLRHAVSLDPEDADIRLELGATREVAGDVLGALEDYKKALELSPDRIRGIVSLSRIYRRLNEPTEAGRVIVAALERGLESAELRREMAVVCIAAGEADAALVQSRKAIALEPENSLSHLILARSLLALEREEDALQELKTTVALSPNAAEAYHYLAQISERKGQINEALAHATRSTMLAPDEAQYAYLASSLSRKAGKLEEAIDHLKRAVECQGAMARWHAELGDLLESLGSLEEALSEYLKAAGQDELPAPHLFLAGRALFALARPTEAAEMLLRAISLDPKLSGAYAVMGHILLQLRQPKAAVDRFLKACELEPDKSEYRQGLAMAYLAQDKLEDAAAALENALVLNPQNASWHADLGRILERLGNWDRALEKLREAVSLDPNEADYAHELGIAYSSVGRYEEARDWLKQALLLESSDRRQCDLGDVLAVLKDYSGAAAEYVAAVSQNPNDWRYHRKLGLLHFELEQVDESVHALESACDLCGPNRTDLVVHYVLGASYAESRRFDDALKELTLAAQRAPGCAAIRTTIGSAYRRSAVRAGGVTSDKEEYRLAVENLRQALNLNANSAEAYAELGLLDELIGDYDTALRKHLKAVALAPANPRYRAAAAEVYLRMAKLEEAGNLVREGLAKIGEDALLVNQLGLVYEAKNTYPKALDAFERACSLDPEKAPYRFNLGRIRLLLGKQTEARRDIERAVQMNPYQIEWRRQLAYLYELLNDWESAAAEFRTILEYEPQDSEALLGVGRDLNIMDRSGEALPYLEQSAKIKPSGAAFDQLAVAWRKQGKLQHAVRCSQQALKREPDNHAFQLNLALTLKVMGQIEKASDEIKRIISENPNLVPARYQLGLLYEERGELQKALSEYTSAAEKAPNEIVYSMAAARVHRLSGQADAALAIMQRTARRVSGVPEVFGELAKIEQARGNFDAASRYFKKAIAIQDRPVFHHDLAMLLLEKGRPNDAVAEMRVAMSMEPASPRWLNGLGKLLEEQNKLDEAMGQYRRALAIDPQDAESHRNLGIALKKQGKFDEAIQELQRALDINPNDADAYKHLTAASASQLLKKNLR